MKKLTYLLLLVLLTPFASRASHAMGGEISYTWLSGNTYTIQYNFYRDCMGINAPAVASITCSSSCYASITASLYPDSTSPQNVQNVCPSVVTSCFGGTANGIERWVYRGTVTLPGTCTDWVFSVSECCRNGTIINLLQSSSQSAYFSALLDNASTPFNSSVQFSRDPVPYLRLGALNSINVGAFDPDNDSISITLVDAMQSNNTPCSYNTPFSGSSPVSSTSGISVNSQNGDISFTPSQAGVFVIAIRADEYRNGVVIGSSTRDFQFTIINSSNQLPYMYSNGAMGGFTSSVCAGDTISFMLRAVDANTGDSTFIDIDPSDLGTVANLQYFGGQQDSVLVQIITDGSLTSPVPHRLNITVRDNYCPYIGAQSYTCLLYVNGCSVDVWPGDANNDLSCNLYDILPIGLGFNAAGTIRTNASLAWTAQPSTDWNQSFVSGVNYKFADCDGSGHIDYFDTLAIAQNYNLTHPVRLANPSHSVNTVGNMYLISSTDTAGPSGQLSVKVNLGDAAHPADHLYGIAFRLTFNPTIIDGSASQFHFPVSQLGTPGNDLLTFVRADWTQGVIDAVAVRMDHADQTVDSTIAIFDVVIVDNVSARTLLQFDLEGVRGIDASGLAKYYSIINDSVDVASGTTGIHELFSNDISIYPNPANRSLKISGMKNDSRIIIRDLNGRAVLSTNAAWSDATISTEHLADGAYVAEIYSADQLIRRKFSVVH